MLLRPLCRRFIGTLRAGRRLAALRLLAMPPHPIRCGVGYDTVSGHFSFRNARGSVSRLHLARSQGKSAGAPAYAPNGTTVSPLSPPRDSPV
eukprot:7006620-Prymnesium_polylepis.1